MTNKHQPSGSTPVSRRDFVKAAAAGVAVPYFVPSSVLAAPGKPGANERLRIGVIGTGNRVSWLLQNWGNPDDMRLVALADCNKAKANVFIGAVKDRFPETVACPRYENYREMLDKQELDGVFVTTPTHGRVLPCIHAAQAGVDIYAEKPVTLTIAEGQALVKAVNKYQRVFQAGTQARSIAVNDWAVRQLASGVIGEIKKVIAPNFDGPVDYKPLARTSAAPAGLNWDFWCNQAPLFPFDLRLAARLEDGWAPYREFDGGGDRWGMTGFGAHAFDQILWALGKDLESPVEAWPHEPGNAMTAVSLRLADGLIIETLDTTRKGPAFGGIFVGDNGKMEINRNRVASNPAGIAQQLPKFPSEHTGGVNHVQNWLDSIRTRKTPRCPVEVAHRQTVICHVINAVRDLGRKLQYDPQTDRFVNDAEANRHPSVDRPRRRGYELPKVLG